MQQGVIFCKTRQHIPHILMYSNHSWLLRCDCHAMRTHLHVAVFLVVYCFVSSVVSCTSSEAIPDTQSCAQENANAFLELHDVLSGQLKEAKELVERLEASIKQASGLLKSEAGLKTPAGPPSTTVSQQEGRDVALPERSSWTSHSSILTQGIMLKNVSSKASVKQSH